VAGTFCSWNVLKYLMSGDILYLGCFGVGTFWGWDILRLGRFVVGTF
jgi:hypothetical protein